MQSLLKRPPLPPGTRWQVYCDLDGVLADFDRGVVERTGVRPGEFRRRRKMWRSLAPPRTENFFSTLPWTRGGAQLWKFLEPLSPAILTGSPSGDWAGPQKKRWCSEQLRLPEDRVLVVDSSDKALFSHPGAVLVDDWLIHRESWEARGGIFIHYTSALESILRLQSALNHLEVKGALPPEWPSPLLAPTAMEESKHPGALLATCKGCVEDEPSMALAMPLTVTVM